jgi:hypothetical protein
MTADFKRNLDLDNHISEGNRLLRGASKETLARDTEESDREYIQLSKKRDILAQKKYKKDYKELHPNQKDIINITEHSMVNNLLLAILSNVITGSY